jgi:hypothetical protein
MVRAVQGFSQALLGGLLPYRVEQILASAVGGDCPVHIVQGYSGLGPLHLRGPVAEVL